MPLVEIGGGRTNIGLAYLDEAARQRQLAMQEQQQANAQAEARLRLQALQGSIAARNPRSGIGGGGGGGQGFGDFGIQSANARADLRSFKKNDPDEKTKAEIANIHADELRVLQALNNAQDQDVLDKAKETLGRIQAKKLEAVGRLQGPDKAAYMPTGNEGRITDLLAGNRGTQIGRAEEERAQKRADILEGQTLRRDVLERQKAQDTQAEIDRGLQRDIQKKGQENTEENRKRQAAGQAFDDSMAALKADAMSAEGTLNRLAQAGTLDQAAAAQLGKRKAVAESRMRALLASRANTKPEPDADVEQVAKSYADAYSRLSEQEANKREAEAAGKKQRLDIAQEQADAKKMESLQKRMAKMDLESATSAYHLLSNELGEDKADEALSVNPTFRVVNAVRKGVMKAPNAQARLELLNRALGALEGNQVVSETVTAENGERRVVERTVPFREMLIRQNVNAQAYEDEIKGLRDSLWLETQKGDTWSPEQRASQAEDEAANARLRASILAQKGMRVK